MKTLTLVRKIGALASWFGPSLLVFEAENTFGSRATFQNTPASPTAHVRNGDVRNLLGSVQESSEMFKGAGSNYGGCVYRENAPQGPANEEDGLSAGGNTCQTKIGAQNRHLQRPPHLQVTWFGWSPHNSDPSSDDENVENGEDFPVELGVIKQLSRPKSTPPCLKAPG